MCFLVVTSMIMSTTVYGCNSEKNNTKAEYTDYGEWSDWTTTPVTENDLCEVETKTEHEITSYDMHYYCTRNATTQQREYRDNSINNEFEVYGLQAAYGENYIEENISSEALNSATIIEPGESTTDGINKSEEKGYSIFDGSVERVFFINSENYSDMTYYRYKERTKTN